MTEGIKYLSISQSNSLLKNVSDPRDSALITLFLNTGIFLNELVDLKVTAVNWDKKILTIPGNRKREIPLNELAFEALAQWSKERPDTRCNALFVTTKGKVNGISARTADHLIRKYAEQAGIKKRVNAQILRNTFAVRLFSQEVSLDKAASILGISDSESINRYIQAAKQTPLQANEILHEVVKKVDTRPRLTRTISRLFSTKPKIAKVHENKTGPLIPSLDQVMIGRTKVLEDIKTQLRHGHAVLLTGPVGVGKTQILKHLTRELLPSAIYISSPTPIKTMLVQLYDSITSKKKKPLTSRSSVYELTTGIKRLTSYRLPLTTILVIDNLDSLKLSSIEAFLPLLESFTILGAVESPNPKLKQLWWKFKQIELKPLSKDSAKELIKYLTQNLAVADYELLENRLINLSDCLPLAIVDMVSQLSHKEVVSVDDIRDVYHEAGIKYRDWTPILLVLWGLVMVSRFIALGTHSFENYILAGVGMAALMTVTKFIRLKR